MGSVLGFDEPFALPSHHHPPRLLQQTCVVAQEACRVGAVDNPVVVAEVERHHLDGLERLAVPHWGDFSAGDAENGDFG